MAGYSYFTKEGKQKARNQKSKNKFYINNIINAVCITFNFVQGNIVQCISTLVFSSLINRIVPWTLYHGDIVLFLVTSLNSQLFY